MESHHQIPSTNQLLPDSLYVHSFYHSARGSLPQVCPGGFCSAQTSYSSLRAALHTIVSKCLDMLTFLDWNIWMLLFLWFVELDEIRTVFTSYNKCGNESKTNERKDARNKWHKSCLGILLVTLTNINVAILLQYIGLKSCLQMKQLQGQQNLATIWCFKLWCRFHPQRLRGAQRWCCGPQTL